MKGQTGPPGSGNSPANVGNSKESAAFTRQMLLHAGKGMPRLEFLREVALMLLELSYCDGVEFWLKENDKYLRCAAAASRGGKDVSDSFRYEILPYLDTDAHNVVVLPEGATDVDRLCGDILTGKHPAQPVPTMVRGTFWVADTTGPVTLGGKHGGNENSRNVMVAGDYASLVIIPLEHPEGTEGLLQLKSRQRCFFNESVIPSYEQVATSVTLALVHQKAQAALRERIKELTCLYGMTQVSDDPSLQLEEILSRIVDLLPPSWQYPDSASARITMDGKTYETTGFRETTQKQAADIEVRGVVRGLVEVVYTEQKPELDEGPFLKEERGLLDAVASNISLMVERREAQDEKAHLQEQLRHADRLATIGQLAAGVAHELNEPLGNILGFAQLAGKSTSLPEQARQDIEKIVGACLHAREIIRKLMTFARQTPPKKTVVNLNDIVQEGLYFLERRCAKQGIEVVRILDPSLPDITADAAQLHQVLVNLAVNALQAMPGGGKLVIRTARTDGHISLVVEDTGTGMSEEVLKRVFMPFFTTKQVGQGLGLGLSVVHGIVSGHRGSIEVQSKPGEGTRFEVILPISSPSGKEEVD